MEQLAGGTVLEESSAPAPGGGRRELAWRRTGAGNDLGHMAIAGGA